MADMMQQPRIDPAQMEALQRAVLAGQAFLYSPKTSKFAMEELRAKGSPPHINAGRAAARIMALVLAQSKGALKPEIMMAAGLLLLGDIVKFMSETGATITPEQQQEAAAVYAQTMMEMFGQQDEAQEPAQQPENPQQTAPQATGLIGQPTQGA